MNETEQKHILLVEDESLTAQIEGRHLKSLGYTLTKVSSGEQAIQIVRTEDPPPDLILMDIFLGDGMDGTDAAEQILAIADIPIVFVSSHIEREIVERTERISSYGFVFKDAGFPVLEATIKMAFKLHEARSRYFDIFSHSINGLCVCKIIEDEGGEPSDFECVMANRAFQVHTGLFSASIEGKRLHQLFKGPEASLIWNAIWKALREPGPAPHELYYEPTGEWYAMQAFHLKNREFTLIIENTTDIKQSEETLHRKIGELERFHRLTVDRELEMIKLKREVNELCRELGREERYRIRGDTDAQP